MTQYYNKIYYFIVTLDHKTIRIFFFFLKMRFIYNNKCIIKFPLMYGLGQYLVENLESEGAKNIY